MILVSNNFLLWSGPQSVDLHGNEAISRALRLCGSLYFSENWQQNSFESINMKLSSTRDKST